MQVRHFDTIAPPVSHDVWGTLCGGNRAEPVRWSIAEEVPVAVLVNGEVVSTFELSEEDASGRERVIDINPALLQEFNVFIG